MTCVAWFIFLNVLGTGCFGDMNGLTEEMDM